MVVVSFPHVYRDECHRRCRDRTAAGWATASLAIRFLTTSARTTAHCRSFWLMCTHAYICGHMRTQRSTHRSHTCRHVRMNTQREKERNRSHRISPAAPVHNQQPQLLRCDQDTLMSCYTPHTHIHNNTAQWPLLMLHKHVLHQQFLPHSDSYMSHTNMMRWL